MVSNCKTKQEAFFLIYSKLLLLFIKIEYKLRQILIINANFRLEFQKDDSLKTHTQFCVDDSFFSNFLSLSIELSNFAFLIKIYNFIYLFIIRKAIVFDL